MRNTTSMQMLKLKEGVGKNELTNFGQTKWHYFAHSAGQNIILTEFSIVQRRDQSTE